VTGWSIIFICGMVLRCAGVYKTRLESGPFTADLTTTDIHRHKERQTHSLTHSNN